MKPGPRDNQYGFTAMLAGAGIPDTGNPCNHGGLAVSKSLRPGEVFEDYVDLADWFAFRKPGTYSIHGWYILPLLRAELGPDAAGPSNTMWDDHASADFEVDVK